MSRSSKLHQRKRPSPRQVAVGVVLAAVIVATTVVLPDAYVALAYEQVTITSYADGYSGSSISDFTIVQKRYAWLPGPTVLHTESVERPHK